MNETIEQIKCTCLDAVILFEQGHINDAQAMAIIHGLRPFFLSLPREKQFELVLWARELVDERIRNT